jgi:hypothetical protein
MIMVEKGPEERTWRDTHEQYRIIEKMQIDKCHYLVEEEDDDDDDNLDDEPVYYSNPNDPIKSPRVTGLTAISTIVQYVQTLPADRFTNLRPFFEFEKRDNEAPREKLMAGKVIFYFAHFGIKYSVIDQYLKKFSYGFWDNRWFGRNQIYLKLKFGARQFMPGIKNLIFLNFLNRLDVAKI